jgi:hypothetical protein
MPARASDSVATRSGEPVGRRNGTNSSAECQSDNSDSSVGSLKTEEKTERQCGQRQKTSRGRLDAVCQFKSPRVPTRGKSSQI